MNTIDWNLIAWALVAALAFLAGAWVSTWKRRGL